LLCSACGDFRTQIVSGDEMILQRMEMNLAH
jgi:Zn finger protein HypA/HybF involved in hydrogenase expression